MAAAASFPDPSQNPVPPNGWKYMPQSDVTPAMSTWAIHLLNDTADYPGPPPYVTIPNVIDGKAIKAMVQVHPPDAQNGAVHRGVSLVEPIIPTPPASGIDVSKYQGTPNFAQVKGSGRSFVFMKVSEGTGLVDSSFANNWMTARAAGLLRGGYLFFHPSENGAAQAQLFLSTLNGDYGELPPVIDFETTDSLSPSNPLIAANLTACVNVISAATKKRPLIYTSPSFWNVIPSVKPIAVVCDLWVANWGVSTPTLPNGWKNWTFWQYTSSASIPGVTGADDADFFNGTLAELQAFVSGVTPPPTPPVPPPPVPPTLPTNATTTNVRLLQAALNACGASSPPLVVDGIWGPLTKAACAVMAK